MSKPIATVIPLGNRCGSTFLLSYLGMTQKSYPFDWTLAEHPQVIDALSHRLEGFLREEDCSPEVRALTAPYLWQASILTNRYGVQFHHLFNPHAPGSIGDKYPDVLVKTLRRCKDFVTEVDSGRPIIFSIYQDRTATHSYSIERVQALVNTISTAFPQAHFQLAIVQDVSGLPTVSGHGPHWQLTHGDYMFMPTYQERHLGLEAEMKRLIDLAAERLEAIVPSGMIRHIFSIDQE